MSAAQAMVRADNISIYSSAWLEKQPLISLSHCLTSCPAPALPHSQLKLLAAARLDLSTCRGDTGRFHRGKQEIKFSILDEKVLKLQYLGHGVWLRSFTLASADDVSMRKMKKKPCGLGLGGCFIFLCHKQQFSREEKLQTEGVPSCVTALPCAGSQLGCAQTAKWKLRLPRKQKAFPTNFLTEHHFAFISALIFLLFLNHESGTLTEVTEQGVSVW